MSVETFKIVQTGSPIRRHHKQRETLIGLGLNRIDRVAEVPNTHATWGMIAKVRHLVRVIDEHLSPLAAHGSVQVAVPEIC
jgi:large subunit ribosomal protein L30